MKRLTNGNKLFYRGFAVAIGCLARDFGSPHLAAQIAKANGVTLDTLRSSGVDPFDLPKSLVSELRGKA